MGTNTLLVSLTTEEGVPVDGADVSVSSIRNHPGGLPIAGRTNTSVDGLYRIPMTWPMMGQWLIEVTAPLPEQQRSFQEQYEVFVYAIRPVNAVQLEYKSIRENQTTISANADREMWIIIPPGTQAMLTEGHQTIPDEIRLRVDGQNTLIIRNDDLTDHTIGPFFIRAGETVRQVFTQPAVILGICSISRTGEISIIVEGAAEGGTET